MPLVRVILILAVVIAAAGATVAFGATLMLGAPTLPAIMMASLVTAVLWRLIAGRIG